MKRITNPFSQNSNRRELIFVKITITGRKVNLRDSFKERIIKKLSKFDKVFGEEAEAIVTVTVEKRSRTVEITVMSKGFIYRAEQRSNDLEEALDLAVAHLSGQIRKNKTKLSKRHKADVSVLAYEPYDEPDDVEEAEDEFRIVRSKRFAVKPMTVEEAVLQMNMLGHQFFMFRNDETNVINLVYRRKDGDYGLLEPEE